METRTFADLTEAATITVQPGIYDASMNLAIFRRDDAVAPDMSWLNKTVLVDTTRTLDLLIADLGKDMLVESGCPNPYSWSVHSAAVTGLFGGVLTRMELAA
ncbi:hypothetical protein [Catenuloplanes indicus]|uniref:Uncharacterized protein n=1 Tax=Catenuloplanes indicus TaxID=137267 RepID=A0AAE3W9B2_9ACTN|nr:hypothetical protein [Catenuloplanes indicus]MDQ0363345.1 hypothetical protein [Catenuloplanes indicus]MDQ0371667.1 hypothetical protein [Catenuloplanes indicus]